MKDSGRGAVWLILWLAAMTCGSAAHASDGMERAGDLFAVGLPAMALGATYLQEDSEGRAQFYRSFFTTLGIAYGLKRAINKQRPDGENYSFPSGHASAAFQGAAFLHRRYGLRKALPAYLGAAFVGYSRVDADRHFVEDVLAGAALGILSARLQVEPRDGVVIVPVLNGDTVGLGLHARW